MFGYRVTIVSNDSEWADRAVQACHEVGGVPERIGWADARSLRDPPAVLLVDLHPNVDDELWILERWAADAWYPLCVASLRPEPGSWEAERRLATLGYRRFLHASGHQSYLEEMQRMVESVIDERSWLVPRAAGAVGCTDAAVVEALALAVIIAPEATTVERWAREHGLKSARGLETLFRKCRVRNPAAVYQWLRLARVVDFAERLAKRPTRDELARAFGYGSGDYLGRRAKAVTGKPLGKLVSLGVEGFFDLMAARLAELPATGDP